MNSLTQNLGKIMSIGIDKAVVGRLKIQGQKFEILVDPNKVLEFKNGKKHNISDMLAYPVIYKDAGTTEEVAQDDVKFAFGTNDVLKAAEKIIRDGDIQLTTDQRRKMTNQKKIQIASIISKKGINPQTNTPHPPTRIEGCIDQIGVKIDPFKSAESQIDEIVSKIKTIIPIKFEKILLKLKISGEHAGRAFPIIKQMGSLKNEKWLDDGSLQTEVEILAGIHEEFLQKISNISKGEYESTIIKEMEI